MKRIRAKKLISERPYVPTKKDEVLDFRIEMWHGVSPEDKREWTSYIDSGEKYYGKLGQDWVSFHGEDINVSKKVEPTEGRRLPDYWIRYVYIAI
jgi:hypothetical protein